MIAQPPPPQHTHTTVKRYLGEKVLCLIKMPSGKQAVARSITSYCAGESRSWYNSGGPFGSIVSILKFSTSRS